MLFGISIVQLCTFSSMCSTLNPSQGTCSTNADRVLPHLDIYHVSFPRDRFAVWASVYTIFALDIFQSIVVACEAWQTLCAGWGRSVNLQFPGWTFTALPIVSSISRYPCFATGIA